MARKERDPEQTRERPARKKGVWRKESRYERKRKNDEMAFSCRCRVRDRDKQQLPDGALGLIGAMARYDALYRGQTGNLEG